MLARVTHLLELRHTPSYVGLHASRNALFNTVSLCDVRKRRLDHSQNGLQLDRFALAFLRRRQRRRHGPAPVVAHNDDKGRVKMVDCVFNTGSHVYRDDVPCVSNDEQITEPLVED